MESTENNKRRQAAKKSSRTPIGQITNILGIILCALLLPCFIVNTTLMISSLLYPDTPPGFMGYTPLVVESDSMVPTFEENDLVVIENDKADKSYEKGDIICFRSGDVYVTHRIVKKATEYDGNIVYTTQGDANNTPDVQPVGSEQILGSYATHFKGLGGFVMFMQTPAGMVCCVLLPIVVICALFWIPSKIAGRKAKRKQAEERHPSY